MITRQCVMMRSGLCLLPSPSLSLSPYPSLSLSLHQADSASPRPHGRSNRGFSSLNPSAVLSPTHRADPGGRVPRRAAIAHGCQSFLLSPVRYEHPVKALSPPRERVDDDGNSRGRRIGFLPLRPLFRGVRTGHGDGPGAGRWSR